jgi:hypothetical protein
VEWEARESMERGLEGQAGDKGEASAAACDGLDQRGDLCFGEGGLFADCTLDV